MKKVQIINGIHTGVGKTFTCCKLLNEGIVNGKKINYLKPIISGFEELNLQESDIGQALSILGLANTMENAQKMAKVFLKEPTSPNIASILEGIIFEYDEVLQFCKEKIKNSLQREENILIEMAGGICTPITSKKTMLDLTLDIIKDFDVKTTLITSNYLGAISHTISACKIFNFDEVLWNIIEPTKYDREIFETLRGFLGEKVVPLGGLEPPRA